MLKELARQGNSPKYHVIYILASSLAELYACQDCFLYYGLDLGDGSRYQPCHSLGTYLPIVKTGAVYMTTDRMN